MAKTVKGSGEAGLISATLNKRPESVGRVIGWDGEKKEPIYAETGDPEVITLDPCNFCGDVHIMAVVPESFDDTWKMGDICPFRLRREDTKIVYNPVVPFCRKVNEEGEIKITLADRELLDMFYLFLDEVGLFD